MSTQCPLRNAMTSAPDPGLGKSLSVTVLHVWPRSLDVLWCRRLGGGPLSRISVYSVPSFRFTMLGWMFPAPTNGVLVFQIAPQSSVYAISEKEKPSE